MMAYLPPSLPLLSPVRPKTELSAFRRILLRNTMSLRHFHISSYSHDSTPSWAHLLSLLLFTLSGMRAGKSRGKCEGKRKEWEGEAKCRTVVKRSK